MEHKSLAERANVQYATAGRRGKRIHYSPLNDETLCGKVIAEYLNVEHVVELLDDQGYDWCTPCGTAAEKRAEARLAAEAERDERLDALAASVAQQHAEVDAHLAEIRQIGAEVDELAAEVTAWGAEVDAVCAPAEDTQQVAESGQQAEVEQPVEFNVAEIVDAIRNSKHRDQLIARAREGARGFGDAVAYYAYGLHAHEIAAAPWEQVRAALLAQQPAVHHFGSTGEAYDATQCRDDIRDGDVLVIEREKVVGFLRSAWPGAITAAHGELSTFTADPRKIDDGKYAASVDLAEQIARELGAPLAGEQHVVEGVIVEHAGTAEGCAPRDVTHPDVVAAREALAGLAAAPLTDHHDFSEPTDDERNVRGYVVNPRGQGRVALYWLEGGMNVRRDVMPHGPALGCLADRMTRRGWAVEKMARSSQCVFAHRPVKDTPPAEAQPAVPAELPAADVDEACLHGRRPRPDVSGDPITWCARKQPNQSAGVWNDEGCVLAADCCVEAANDCAQYNVEAEAPAGDPEFEWALMCTQHEEQMLDGCEECNAVPAEDRCKECSGKGCHWCHWTGEQQPEAEVDGDEQATVETELAETVEQAEAGDGTWRGGWIASTPPATGDVLFDVCEGEQGALFD
ncbi:hypothetical protein ACGF4C_30480 [Streptomyces sp. NPDC048197]|uniref:hypothetical protein n=1 Tax=Streptomyces sp. NPDC048197 TaxID=3365511 RepID=UPI003716F944